MFEYSHLCFMPRLTFWQNFSQQFVCVFFVTNLSCFFWHFILNIWLFVLSIFGHLSHVAADKFLRSPWFFFLGKASDNDLCPWQFLFTNLIYSGQTFLGKVLSSIMGKIMRGRACTEQ